MQEQPTATVTRQYGGGVMTADFFIKYDERGNIDHARSYAWLRLEDLGNTRFPLVWSHTMKPAEARAALEIFESTGITLQE